ncbi:MAG: hypothetical protein F6K11_35450, partial [Leptolyngbya sp. SIO3F4]|nr:hypothetical protein [Leptolyngbya sp. SIO3F4]
GCLGIKPISARLFSQKEEFKGIVSSQCYLMKPKQQTKPMEFSMQLQNRSEASDFENGAYSKFVLSTQEDSTDCVSSNLADILRDSVTRAMAISSILEKMSEVSTSLVTYGNIASAEELTPEELEFDFYGAIEKIENESTYHDIDIQFPELAIKESALRIKPYIPEKTDDDVDKCPNAELLSNSSNWCEPGNELF